MSMALVHDGIDYWAGQAPDRPALVLDGQETLSYADLARWSDGIAERLQALGVGPADRVIICGANCMAWPAAQIGVLKAGATVVPLNERFVSAELADLLKRVEPAAIITDEARAELIAPLAPDTPLLRMEDLPVLRQGAGQGWTARRVDPDTLSLVVFTSGTTGRPKGVTFSHRRQLESLFEFRVIEPAMSAGMHVLMPFSMQAGPGSLWAFPLTMLYGGTMHFVRRFDAQLLLDLIVDHRISYINGMPVLYEQISRLPGFAGADLSCVTMAQIGGARVSSDLTRRWRDHGVVLRQLYGMTEAGGLAIVASEGDARAKPDSCGRGGMFTRIRVVDEAGADCSPGTPGEVLIAGPGFTNGYFGDPEATAQLLDANGAMITGDIGVIDAEGFFTFVDRSKDIIISGGFNISPSEIEHAITMLDGVLEVAVFSVPDAKFGEAPAACIHASRPVAPDEVIDHVKARLAGYKVPRHVFVSETPLPRMASNKIAKRDLAAHYGGIVVAAQTQPDRALADASAPSGA